MTHDNDSKPSDRSDQTKQKPVQGNSPLSGLLVVDLTRVLAGPTCTQLLGDLGADVIKIENPKSGGDDTRAWGPPYIKQSDGRETDLSTYYIAANRNKRSVAIDIATKQGQAQIKALIAKADIFVENFKTGGLAKYDLDYASVHKANPALIYCSITGYGQTGPNAEKPGYDIMVQGYGGIMSLTGEAGGSPQKSGVAIADLMCGMYASSGILAALHHRHMTGEGQHIDLALVDSQVAWLVNQATTHLETGKIAPRAGNAHPNIVPYQAYDTKDGHIIIAVGNNGQFEALCAALGRPEFAQDPRFVTNPARVAHRAEFNAIMEPIAKSYSTQALIELLEKAGVPCGPVNDLAQVFATDQIAARDMRIDMPLAADPSIKLKLVGNPLKFSASPVSYRMPPPQFGEHTREVFEELGIKPDEAAVDPGTDSNGGGT